MLVPLLVPLFTTAKALPTDTKPMAYYLKKSRVSNLFKRTNGSYYGRCQLNGKRLKKSFGMVSLEEAQEELRKWISGLRGFNYEPDNKGEILQSTVGDCMADVQKGVDENTQTSAAQKLYVKNRIKFICKQWQGIAAMEPSSVTNAQVRTWIAGLSGYSPDTLRGSLLYLRQTFDVAVEAGICTENPCDGVRPPPRRNGDHERRKITAAQFDAIIGEMKRLKGNSGRASLTAELLAALGARIGELVGNPQTKTPPLRWADIDWSKRQVSICTEKGRGDARNARRVIPFYLRLERVLRAIQAKAPHAKAYDAVAPTKVALRSLRGACKRLHTAGKLAPEITHITHHDCRHLFASWAIAAGIDVPTVSKLLGHRDGGALVMRTYTHLITSHLHSQITKLDPPNAETKTPKQTASEA